MWDELRERRVVRVAIIYLVAGWTALEVSETLTSILELPPRTPRIVFFGLLLGLPLVLSLTWAFQWTPEGLRRARPPAEGPASRRPLWGAFAVGALVTLVLTWVAFPRSAAEPVLASGEDLDPDAVAVLPFRVSGAAEEVSYLGVGFQELLSTRLDGEVGPRSVNPAAVAGLIADQGETGALNIAGRLGAGLAISGSVVGTASHVVVEAQMTRQGEGAPVSARSEGPPDSVAAMANEIWAGLLSVQAGEYEETVSDLTSRDPLALRDYLLGKAAWRDGRWYDAVDYFGRAMDLDPTFALAGLARADGLAMAIGVEAAGGLELAMRHRDRLSHRDRTYLELRWSEAPRTWAERLAAAGSLVRELPDRVEAWDWLSEERLHFRNDLPDDWHRESERILRTALDLNPRYFPAVEHLMVLELLADRPDTLQAMAARYMEIRGNVNPVFRGLVEGTGRLEIDSVALSRPDVDPNWIWTAPTVAVLWPDRVGPEPAADLEVALAVLEEQQGREPLDLFRPESVGAVAYAAQVAFGRPQRARQALERAGRPSARKILHSAVWDGVFAEEAEEEARSLRDRMLGLDSLTSDQVQDLTAAEVWSYVSDPGYAGPPEVVGRIRRAAEAAAHPTDLEMEAHALLLEAWIQARRGGPAEATLRRLDEIFAQGPGMLGSLDKRAFLLATSALYDELGRPLDALRTLERRSFLPSITHEVEIFRRMGRYAEAAGDTARALREYGKYLFLRSDVEPSVEAEVQEVRGAVARLERDPAP